MKYIPKMLVEPEPRLTNWDCIQKVAGYRCSGEDPQEEAIINICRALLELRPPNDGKKA